MAQEAKQAGAHEVPITLNDKPVLVEGPRRTGLEIKQAAIAQGVQIDTGFLLYEHHGAGAKKLVGDDDEVAVHKGSAFTAIADDDNS
jgi:hypothetical protein